MFHCRKCGRIIIKKIAPVREITTVSTDVFRSLARRTEDERKELSHVVNFSGTEYTPEEMDRYIEKKIKEKKAWSYDNDVDREARKIANFKLSEADRALVEKYEDIVFKLGTNADQKLNAILGFVNQKDRYLALCDNAANLFQHIKSTFDNSKEVNDGTK